MSLLYKKNTYFVESGRKFNYVSIVLDHFIVVQVAQVAQPGVAQAAQPVVANPPQPGAANPPHVFQANVIRKKRRFSRQSSWNGKPPKARDGGISRGQ